jgi:hypothetical protein
MNRLSYRDLLGWATHPSEEDLLSYLDRQLPARRTERIRKHLEGCWRCRAQHEEFENSIAGIVKNLNSLLEDSTVFPPPSQTKFEERLRRLARQTELHPSFLGLFASVSRTWSHNWLSMRLVLGLLTGVVILLFFLPFGSSPPISAKELLRRTEVAERTRIQGVTEPVIYQKLQVRRRDDALNQIETVSWETWNDLKNSRFRQRVQDAKREQLVNASGSAGAEGGSTGEPALDSSRVPRVLQELEAILRDNGISHHNPLAPANYASWQKSVRHRSEKVQETLLPDGQKALTLKTAATGPFEMNDIVEAELVVRTSDWHPVTQRLEVQGERGVRDYELREMDFAVLASSTLTDSFFREITPAPTFVASIPAASERPPTSAETLASEIEAQFALHRVGACVGRPISVVTTESGQIEVRGIVETQARQSELTYALRGIPWVTVRVQTTQEQPFEPPKPAQEPQAAIPEPGTAVLGVEGTLASPGRLALQDLLEQHFRRAGAQTAGVDLQIAALSHEASSLSEAALEEVWALRRLAEWAPSAGRAELRFASRRLLEAMVRDHENALRSQAGQLRTLLQPILESLLLPKVAAGPQVGTEGSQSLASSNSQEWKTASLQLFTTVDRMVRLTLGLFADAHFPTDSRETSMSELLSLFDRFETQFQALDIQMNQAFAESGEALAVKSREQ